MKTNRNAEALLQKYKQGTCTLEERELVEKYFNRHILNNDRFPTAAGYAKAEAQLEKTLKKHILRPAITTIETQRRIAIAASVLLVMAIGYYFYAIVEHPKSEVGNIAQNDVLPGGNKATLTLTDGSIIDLSSEHDGIVMTENELKYEDGSRIPLLRGDIPSSSSHSDNGLTPPRLHNSNDIVEYVLSTPLGGQYQITLPDGSKVWLNAASTLKYPSQFASEKREVTLVGEAYFEVTNIQMEASNRPKNDKQKSKTPFIVKTRGQHITVLGTAFNVSAYSDEKEIKTTLVNGTVLVSLANNAQTGKPMINNQLASGRTTSMMLHPGQQAIVREKEPPEVRNANVNNEIAWKNGLFSFDNKTFQQVMTELSRWYNFDIVYDGPVPNDSFFGIAHRSDKLSLVLDLLESAELNYRLENKAGGNGHKLIISTIRKEDKMN